MENKEDTGMNSFHGSATGLNLKFTSSRTDDFSKWPSLAVESSFSYVANSKKEKKTRKVAGSPHYHKQFPNSTTPQNGISTAQGVNKAIKSQYKTVSTTEGKEKSCVDKDKQDFKSDLSLTGKRLQLSPEFWSPDYALLSRSGSDTECKSTIESSEGNRLHPESPTFSLSNMSSLYSNEVNPRSHAIFLNNRHRLSAFSPRPFGQSWVGYTERQKAWAQETNGPPEDILALGARQHLRTRQRLPSHCHTPSARLKRTKSNESGRHHIPRTRSASLPVPSNLHESRMFMEWNEKRTGGVTYVTPVLNTLSDGDLSCYTSSKAEDKF